MKKKRVVVIGGGTGLSVLVRGLKKLPIDLTAIVTIADDGGSSGRLRTEMEMPPPGDIRNVLLAMSETEPLLERLMQHRFKSGNGLSGHSVGNLLIAAMTEITGDFPLAVKELSKVLAVKGEVLPATLTTVTLKAEMSDGEIICGESQIPLAKKKIARVFIEPKNAKALPEALIALKKADLIVIGPGSLYTSIIPNLLVREIYAEINKSKAKKIYVCNVMTQPGETDGYSCLDHVLAIEKHTSLNFFQYLIVNNAPITLEVREQYREKGADPVLFNQEDFQGRAYQIISDNFLVHQTYLRHNMDRLATKIMEILS